MRAKVWFSSKTHLRQRSPIRMPRIGALWLSFSKHTASRESLRKPREGQNVFGSACSIPANSRKFFEAFAAFLQTPESFSRPLQHSCKRQKVFRGLCSIPANSKKFFEAFAAFLQTPKSFSRPLQRSCKHQKILRGLCSVSANTFKTDFGFYSALSKTCSKDKAPHSFVELMLRIE